MSQFDPPPSPDDEYAPRPIGDDEYRGPGENETFEVADEDDYMAADHEKKWYYVQFNQQKGPISTPEIKLLIKTQQIKKDDLVWKAGMADWVTIIHLPELQESIPGFIPPKQQQTNTNSGPSYYPQGMSASTWAPNQPQGESFENKAILGFVLAIVGFMSCQLVSIPGMIISKQALDGMARSRNEAGKGLATAGYWVGLVGVIICALYVLGFCCYLAVGLSAGM